MQTKFTNLYQFAMKVLARAECQLIRSWQETAGQDLVEYALMAGFVAVAAGALFPPVATIFSKITLLLTAANAPGQLVLIGLRERPILALDARHTGGCPDQLPAAELIELFQPHRGFPAGYPHCGPSLRGSRLVALSGHADPIHDED